MIFTTYSVNQLTTLWFTIKVEYSRVDVLDEKIYVKKIERKPIVNKDNGISKYLLNNKRWIWRKLCKKII